MRKIITLVVLTLLISVGYYKYSQNNLITKSEPTTSAQLTPRQSYKFTASSDKTNAYDLLSSQVEVKTKDFGGAGLFVESINGLNGDNSHYWAFYVNGKYAEQGITQTTLNDGDIIEFKYEAITQ